MKGRGKWKTPLIVGGVGALVVLGIVVGLILPKAGQIRGKQKDLAQAKTVQSGLVLQLAELRGAAKEAPANRAKLAKLQVQVPELANLPEVIRQINTAADKSAVDFVSISPTAGVSTTNASVSAITTQLDVTGSYFAVDEFLYRLETMARISKVTNISLTPKGEGSSSDLSVTLTALFYTTDISIGPGSEPGHTDAAAAASASAAAAAPAPSPSNGG